MLLSQSLVHISVGIISSMHKTAAKLILITKFVMHIIIYKEDVWMRQRVESKNYRCRFSSLVALLYDSLVLAHLSHQ
jgi:hypothetical protein